MNNQAAQTMPELPPSFARVHNDGYWTLRVRDTAEFIVHDSRQTPAQEVYSSGQMRDMYQQGYAAALSQTAGVVVSDGMVERACKKYAFREDGALWPDAYSEQEVISERTLMREFLEHVLAAAPAASGVDTSTNVAWAARAQEKIAAMEAASVSERAELSAGDAVFAFSAMLTSLPHVVPFGAAAWATPGVDLATAFNEANGLSVSINFPSGLKFPEITGILLARVKKAAEQDDDALSSPRQEGDSTAASTKGVTEDAIERKARELFDAQADALAAPWDVQWDRTKQYWRKVSREALLTSPTTGADGDNT